MPGRVRTLGAPGRRSPEEGSAIPPPPEAERAHEASGRRIRVAVADGDPFARHALRTALLSAGGFELVGEASSGLAAVEVVNETEPDILLMDADLPGLDALAVTRRIARDRPATRVVVLETEPDETRQYEAIWAGAVGTLAKDVDAQRVLPRVVRSVASGQAAVSREFAMRLIERFRQARAPVRGMRPVQSPLTEREWEIVDLLGSGASTRTIAARLGLSSNTVYTHVRHILRKLGVHSRREAVEVADKLRRGEPAAEEGEEGTSDGESAGPRRAAV